MITMGSVTVFVFFYLSKAIWVPCYKQIVVTTKRKKVRAFFDHLIRRLVFNDIHRIFIESYIEFLIAIYLNFAHPLFTTGGEIFAYGFAVFSSIGVFFFIPFSFRLLLKSPKKNWNKKLYIKIMGGLYDEVKTNNVYQISYYLVFVFRRWVYVFTAFFFQHFAF